MRGVSAGRVSQWISEGKIKPNALVGEGRAALINVDVATQQLRDALDISQRFGLNGVSTRLDSPPAAAAAPEPARQVEDSVEAKIKAEKLRHAQLTTARLEEEDRRQRGVYVVANEARAEMTRLAADLLKMVEGALPDFASAVAAKFSVSQRDALHLLRAEFRTVRARASALHAVAAEEASAAVPDELNLPETVQ